MRRKLRPLMSVPFAAARTEYEAEIQVRWPRAVGVVRADDGTGEHAQPRPAAVIIDAVMRPSSVPSR